MLNELKNLNVDRLQLDEALALSAFATQLKDEYEKFSVPVPEWLDNHSRTLKQEIRMRQQDQIRTDLRKAKARLETLKPDEVKRKEAAAEIKRLEALMIETE